MSGLTNQELTILIRALSFYGQDLAKNGAGASVTRSSTCSVGEIEMETVLRLICEFSHSLDNGCTLEFGYSVDDKNVIDKPTVVR
jgi:hypothetical protein